MDSPPVDTKTAYSKETDSYGMINDPMVGKKIGEISNLAGGLPLYNSEGVLLGGIGGDTPCSDHNVVWRV